MTLIRSGTGSGDGPLRINTPGKEQTMAEQATPLRVYKVTMGRNETTMQLSDAGVEEYKAIGYLVEPLAEPGAKKKAEEKSVQAAPRDKARGAQRNK